MTEEPDPDRLKALEQRLQAAKAAGADRRGARTGPGFSQGEVAWRMVVELVTGMVLGVGLGYGLDRALGTQPFLLVIFSLLGFAAGVRVMLGTARDMERTKAGQARDGERD